MIYKGIETCENRNWPYKTSLCKFFIKGQCSREAACTYAHSEEEIKKNLKIKKYVKEILGIKISGPLPIKDKNI